MSHTTLYNSLYDGAAYKAVRNLVLDRLRIHHQQMGNHPKTRYRHNEVMNLIIDTSLELCGHPHYPGAHLRLAHDLALHNNEFDIETVAGIQRYLQRFANDAHPSPPPEDLLAAWETFYRVYRHMDEVRDAALAASRLHSWQGNTAHYLLWAASTLLEGASTVLNCMTNDAPYKLGYAQEKLHNAITSLLRGLETGLADSGLPQHFDFSHLAFPHRPVEHYHTVRLALNTAITVPNTEAGLALGMDELRTFVTDLVAGPGYTDFQDSVTRTGALRRDIPDYILEVLEPDSTTSD